MPHYKLYYFDLKANAEMTRLIFAAAGVPFDDIRIKQEDWPGKFKSEMPFGQMPVLEVDGVKLAQSRAINRYLARQFGLAGKTAWEEAQADSIIEQHHDYFLEMMEFFKFMDKSEEEKMVKYKEIALPARDKFFGFMKKLLAKLKSGYLVGDSLTWADMYLSEGALCMQEKYPDFLDGYPEIEKHAKMVAEQPGIKRWRETRPFSPY